MGALSPHPAAIPLCLRLHFNLSFPLLEPAAHQRQLYPSSHSVALISLPAAHPPTSATNLGRISPCTTSKFYSESFNYYFSLPLPPMSAFVF